LALDVTRFAALAPALQRRLLRYAAQELGVAPNFAATEALRTLALSGRVGQKLELEHGLRAERTPRELSLSVGAASGSATAELEYSLPVPGEVLAPAFGIRLRIAISRRTPESNQMDPAPQPTARLRNWKPGDRVKLRHAAGPRKIKEVLERLRVTGSGRAVWPVLEFEGRIVWMQGVEVEPERGVTVSVDVLIDNSHDRREDGVRGADAGRSRALEME
jgi:tRNA(Ile)-lysidine synthase